MATILQTRFQINFHTWRFLKMSLIAIPKYADNNEP